MADFQTSTHRSKWIFTPQKLVEKRKAANQRAKQLLEKNGTSRMEVDSDGSLSFPERQVNNSGDNASDKHSRPKGLNVEDEQLMRVYYEFKLREVCSAFYFPHKIQATALVYFKRFYLQWSVMEHDPKIIMLTCIYTACKIEENHVSAEELGKGISQDHQMILNYEMIVLQTLEFDLIVFAPYRSIEGFIIDMEEYGFIKDEHVQKLKEIAYADVDKMMFTDAPLLFPPAQLKLYFEREVNHTNYPRKGENLHPNGLLEADLCPINTFMDLFQLALAALRSANEVLRVLDFERYIGNNILSHQDSGHTILELLESLGAIDSLVSLYKFPAEKDMKHKNRKLKSCWGDSSHDDKKREKKSKHKSHKNSSETRNGPYAA